MVFNRVVNASAVCSGNTCTLPLTSDLYAGSYTWWITGKNVSGEGPWISMNFVLSVTPGPVQRISPTGNITNRRPTLSWQRNINISWYGLWLGGPQGELISQWYNANSVCNTTTCSISPFTSDLPAGNYSWWMSSVSNSGNSGPWDGTTFTIAIMPGTVVQTSPTGDITDRRPTLTWQREFDSNWYGLTVYDRFGTVVLTEWHDANSVCSVATCTLP